MNLMRNISDELVVFYWKVIMWNYSFEYTFKGEIMFARAITHRPVQIVDINALIKAAALEITEDDIENAIAIKIEAQSKVPKLPKPPLPLRMISYDDMQGGMSQ